MIKTGITRRQFSTALAGSAAITGICPPFARAQQGYPNRPVRFILPFGAAGVAFGRNVWGAPDPTATVRSLVSIVHAPRGRA